MILTPIIVKNSFENICILTAAKNYTINFSDTPTYIEKKECIVRRGNKPDHIEVELAKWWFEKVSIKAKYGKFNRCAKPMIGLVLFFYC